MAEFSAAGITPTDLTGYTERLEAAMQAALGNDLNLDPETPQGQIIGVLALILAESDELAVYVAAGQNLRQAIGRQLQDYGVLFNLPFISGERSTVTATLSGSAGTIVPAGSRARTAVGAIFATDTRATIGAGGTVDVLFRSVENGPIVASAGELIQIVDVVSGWIGGNECRGGRAGPGRGNGRRLPATLRRRSGRTCTGQLGSCTRPRTGGRRGDGLPCTGQRDGSRRHCSRNHDSGIVDAGGCGGGGRMRT